jgi:hypothetical protein
MVNPSEGILESLVRELGQRIDCSDVYGAKKILPEIQRRVEDYERDANQAHIKYLVSKTPTNQKREGKNQIDFDNWQKGIIDPLKMQLGAMRSLLFRNEMDYATLKRPGFKRVPFFYYDFYSKKTVCTPGVIALFGIKERETVDLPLKALARKFIREDERERLTTELKHGNMIKDYLLKTRSEVLGELVVNAYPLLYGKEPVGFGVFLYSAVANKFTIGRSRVFSQAVEEVVNKLGSEFQVIRQNVNNGSY